MNVVASVTLGWLESDLDGFSVYYLFQIYIHYHLPDGIKVCAKLSAPNASPRDVGWCDDYKHDDGHGPDEFSYT